MVLHNIYYMAPISGADAESLEAARKTIRFLQGYGHVMTEHIARPDLFEFERKNMERGVNIAHRDFGWLADTDIAVADLTRPTTGGGMEVVYALEVARIPTLALRHVDARGSMANHLQHPLLRAEAYRDQLHLENLVTTFIEGVGDRHVLYPNYFVYDAIDGAGKGAFHDMLLSWSAQKGLNAFDAVDYFNREAKVPSFDEVAELNGGVPDILLVCEPTFGEMGRIVRQELISSAHTRSYDALAAAHGYSLDREILFKRLLKPALNKGVVVASDRSVLTSEVYQPAQSVASGYNPGYFLGVVRGLPGNQLALQHVPGLLALLQVPVEVAMKRLENRPDKQDDAVFETNDFQSVVAETYKHGAVRDSYVRKGTVLVDVVVPPKETREETIARAENIWDGYVQKVGLF